MTEETNKNLEEKKEAKVEKIKKEEKAEKNTAEAPKEKVEEKKTESKSEKKEESKSENKKTETKVKKVPKTEAVVNSFNAHLSPKTSAAVCKFIVGKTIDQAISELEEVAAGRKAIPMKGEIPHRKGKIMSGRFPKNASEHFIKLLKALAGNVNVNGLEEPIISEAIANIGSRPYGKFGSVRRKRAHIKIIAKNKSDWRKVRSKKAKMNKNKKSRKNKKANSNNNKENKK